MFLRLQTQWVIGGMGGAIGLNYQSVEFLFKIYRVKDKIKMLESISEIELGALEAINSQAEKKRSSDG